jgi:hypothetical protein
MQDDFEHTRAYARRPSAPGLDRDSLRDAIAEEESVFATLTAQQAESRNRLAALRAELAALDTEPDIRVRMPLAVEGPIPQTPSDKVRLQRPCLGDTSSAWNPTIGCFRARTPCRVVDSVTSSDCLYSMSQEHSATLFFLTTNCAHTPTTSSGPISLRFRA